MLSNSLFWQGVGYVVLGIVIFFLDARFGTRFYRKYYDNTHPEPLPASVERGYLVGRTIRGRLTAALIVAAFIAGVSLYAGAKIISSDGKMELSVGFLLWYLLVVPVMLSIGFFLAALMKRSGGVEKVAGSVIDTMDKAERGDLSPIKDAVKAGTERAKAAANEVARGVGSMVDEFDPGLKPKGEVGQPPAPPPAEPVRRGLGDSLNNFKKR